MQNTRQAVSLPPIVGRMTEGLYAPTQGPFCSVKPTIESQDGIWQEVTEQLEVNAKANFALRYMKTILALCCKPSEISKIVRSGHFDEYVTPVHFLCTSLTLLMILISIFGSEPEAEGGLERILKEEFLPLLFFSLVIIPGCFCGHLCLLGKGRKFRHMVYLQCYANGTFVLFCGLAGAFGFSEQTGNIMAVPTVVAFLWFVAVSWYIIRLVYGVSFFRLWIAFSVSGVVSSSILSALVMSALTAAP
jgi:hypothetical protein